MIVELHGFEVFGRHGVLAEEELDGQVFLYDVELEVEEPASDLIEEAVDYRLVADCVRDVSNSRSYDLIESLDLNEMVLVGHSTGGGELARYISRHGTSRVAKVVLLDSIVTSILPHTADGEPEPGSTAAFDPIRAGVAHDRSSFYQDLSAPFFGANRDGSTATQGMRDLFWFQGLLGSARAQYDTTYSWQLDYSSDIAKCDVPLLVIHCEDDQIVPIDATARQVPSVVPHAQLLIYPGGSHGIAIVEPEKVNADLLAFFKS